MTTSNLDSTGAQFAWDSTSLTAAQDCLWKYKAMILDGWTGNRTSAHLTFGGLYATALEHFHKHLAEGLSKEEALREVVRETLFLSWEYEWEELPEGESSHDYSDNYKIIDGKVYRPVGGTPWHSDHNTKTRANLIRTVVWYVDHFDPDPLEVIYLSDGRPAVEYSFALEIDDGLVYSGHIDRLVRYNGDVFVQDQKTTGTTLSSFYFEGFNPDIQMTGYTFAAKAILPEPVRGVIIDAAQIAVGFSRFERGFTYRTPAQLEEWYNDTLYHINLAREATKRGEFPRNRASCGKYGGCMFRDVCARSPEVRDQFLKADFTQRPAWNPLEKR